MNRGTRRLCVSRCRLRAYTALNLRAVPGFRRDLNGPKPASTYLRLVSATQLRITSAGPAPPARLTLLLHGNGGLAASHSTGGPSGSYLARPSAGSPPPLRDTRWEHGEGLVTSFGQSGVVPCRSCASAGQG